MLLINIYLNFNGNTEEAFNFYRSVLGGEFVMIQRFGETPEADRVGESDKNKIMHISLRIGNHILMGTDTLESMGHHTNTGTNFHISLATESKDEADRIYAGLSAGERQKSQWQSSSGERISECSQINSVFNGWSILIQITIYKVRYIKLFAGALEKETPA